jgi:hypothetical protein
VVVHDLDLRRALRRPNKAHPELVVDPDRVLLLAVARQSLKSVAWRRPQVAEIARGAEVTQSDVIDDPCRTYAVALPRRLTCWSCLREAA